MLQSAAKPAAKDPLLNDTDEIDVIYYLGTLRRRWREILLATLAAVALTAAAVLLLRYLTPPLYEATATATILRTFTNVEFDSRFTTSSDAMTTDSNSVDSRRAALVALANSAAIAQQVIEQLGEALPVELRSTSRLLKAVTTEMATTGRSMQSDLINFNVQAPTPDLAAAIANAWAGVYVKQVNSVYGQVPDDMLDSVAAQLVDARTAYAEAQAGLEGYIATSQLDSLDREITTITTTLTSLEQGKIDALDGYMNTLVDAYTTTLQTYVEAQTDAQMLIFTKVQEGDLARVSAYLDAYNAAQLYPFLKEKENVYATLDNHYSQWQRTSALLTAARTLQEQVAGGDSAAAGSELAVQVLNLQVVNNGSALSPLEFQVTAAGGAPAAGSAGLRSQVDAAVTSLENQIKALEQEIDRLNQSLRSGDDFQELNAVVPADSDLRQAIALAYPALFQTGVFSSTEFQSSDNALLEAGQAQATTLLNLINVNELPTTSLPGAPMSLLTMQLEEQLRGLQERLEIEKARKLQFERERDLAWNAVEALSNKQAELQLARAAANSEVRLSSVAVPLDEPVERVSLLLSLLPAALAGLILGIVLAFIREFAGGAFAASPDRAAGAI